MGCWLKALSVSTDITVGGKKKGVAMVSGGEGARAVRTAGKRRSGSVGAREVSDAAAGRRCLCGSPARAAGRKEGDVALVMAASRWGVEGG